MNIGKIIKGYGAVLFGLLTFSAIAGVCILAGIAVAYPLWKLAVTNTGLYTIISISLFVCGIFYLLIKSVIKAYKKSPRGLIISILKKITVIGGLLLCIGLVLTFNKIPALIVLVLIFVIYGFLAFGIDQTKNNGNEGL
ncbi:MULTISPECIES: hypothetical protein [unclassified Treponema]|uniref:hypothetical protein n=1 Tax=unclassified Treponema TaxID=2638727 RepID=UPI0020A462E8|nr:MULTISPECIES: hypothetical protein [unclassified Treponema]UTC67934.1 hypothetical protein E4O06_04615 [Treponema sp. OMZ 789]UTC70655.1 hypothetical protein E4O01_04605 [Treponema sp. OMZ 790]UTC73379.1 hypothetical protein E4O02_04850 [Treponema sp. OMZ 791]